MSNLRSLIALPKFYGNVKVRVIPLPENSLTLDGGFDNTKACEASKHLRMNKLERSLKLGEGFSNDLSVECGL